MRLRSLIILFAALLALGAATASAQPGRGPGDRPPGGPGGGPDRERGERPAFAGPVGERPGAAPEGGSAPGAVAERPGGAAAQGPLRGRGRGLTTSCTVSTTGMFDPIVFPGEPMAGHTHVFFGGSSIAFDSTPASLRAANASGTATTCRNTRDGSAYWVPQLLADGVAVDPLVAIARYRPARGDERATFPLDFQVVAGSRTATGKQPGIGYRCLEPGANRRLAALPPTCAAGTDLAAVVRFATCWDGTRGGAPDQSHVAQMVAGECPETHPISIPSLELTVRYPSDGLAHDWSLASGSAAGYHADFMNGWDERSLERLAGRAPRG